MNITLRHAAGLMGLLTCTASPASAEGIIEALSDAIWGPKAIEVTVRSAPKGATIMLGVRETQWRTDGTVYVHPSSMNDVAVRWNHHDIPISKCVHRDLGGGRHLYECALR